MSIGSTTSTQASIQEQLWELKVKEQAFEQKQREHSFQLKLEAFEAKERAFEQRQKDTEQAFKQQQNDIEQAFELKQYKAKLDLQRREDALANQFDQLTADIKKDRAILEQERFSFLQLKIANEFVTGPNLMESFHVDGLLMSHQSEDTAITSPPIPTTAPIPAEVAQQLAMLDIRTRQLRAISKLVEHRYDDAVRKEYSNKQKEQDLATDRQNFLQEIVTERQNILSEITTGRQEIVTKKRDLEKERVKFFGKIDFLRLDLLQRGPDNTTSMDVIDFAMNQHPIERLLLIKTLQLDQNNANLILQMEEVDFRSDQFQHRIKACQFLKLGRVKANRIMSLPQDKLINDSLYSRYLADPRVKKERLTQIINSCKANAQRHGNTDFRPQVEYRSPQLDKQFHGIYFHYCLLLDVLYPSRGGTSDQSDNAHPRNPSENTVHYTIFSFFGNQITIMVKSPNSPLT